MIMASDQTSPSRCKGRRLCGAKTASRRLLPGQSGAWQGALPLPRWQIDGSEDAGWSSAYRRGPATATAWLSREGSSERAQMRGSEGGRCRRETSLQIESVSDNVTPTRSAIAHVGRAAAGCAFPVLASALPIAPTKSPKTNDATSSVA
jgi:hypothetical protein